MTALRLEVFEREAYMCQHDVAIAGFTAYRCLNPVTWESGHLAHIISRGRGGDDSAENTCCKCAHCHLVLEHNPKSVPAKGAA